MQKAKPKTSGDTAQGIPPKDQMGCQMYGQNTHTHTHTLYSLGSAGCFKILL